MSDFMVSSANIAATVGAQEEERKKALRLKNSERGASSPPSGVSSVTKDSGSFLGLLFTKKTVEAAGIEGKPIEEALAILKDDITMAADELVEKMTDKSFDNYRQAVKRLTRFVVDHGFDISKRQAIRSRKPRRTIYTQITVIDEKLNEIAAQIFLNQRNKFVILARTEEIAGLIVDMLF